MKCHMFIHTGSSGTQLLTSGCLGLWQDSKADWQYKQWRTCGMRWRHEKIQSNTNLEHVNVLHPQAQSVLWTNFQKTEQLTRDSRGLTGGIYRFQPEYSQILRATLQNSFAQG